MKVIILQKILILNLEFKKYLNRIITTSLRIISSLINNLW